MTKINNITVAISSAYHDRGITVLDNGKLIDIILEDRISRKKYDYYFPLSSLNVLKSKYPKIDKIILVNCYDNIEYKTIIQQIRKLEFNCNEIVIGKAEDHHVYHAVAGFCSSNFDEATVLVIDGFGGVQHLKVPHPTETDNKLRGVTSTSIWNISYKEGITKEYSKIQYTPTEATPITDYLIDELKENKDEWSPTPDIGVMYTTVGNHLGFPHVNDAGKVMGLSSYGEENNLPSFLWKDTIECNHALIKNNYSLYVKHYPEFIVNNEQTYKNIAHNIQKSYEKVLFARVEQALSLSKSNNLIFTGGCALNVIGNYLLKKRYPDINLYIDPIANDSNQSLGAAKYYFYNDNGYLPKDPLNSLFLGPSYTKEEILNSIKKYA